VRKLGLIVAVARNGVIGVDGDLPWRLPEDLKHFKRTTIGHPIIMGRKTYESIGRPLPKRLNIVVTRQRDFSAPGCTVVHSFDAALEAGWAAHEEPFVIGGAALYAAALPHVTRFVLTEVDQDVAGDTRFPHWDRTRFVETDRREGQGVTFVTLERPNPI